MSPVDPATALRLCEQIAAIGVCVSSLEWLSQPAKLRDDGFFSWEIFKLRQRWMIEGRAARCLDPLLRWPGVVGLLALRLLLGILLAAVPAGLAGARASSVALLACLALLLRFRSPVGLDGSDQMSTLLLVSLTLAHVVGTPLAVVACLWFVTAQACLAYSASGWLKLGEAGWRDGAFLGRVLSSMTYGHARLGAFLTRNRRASMALSLGFILLECSFPLVLVLPQPAVWALLGCALFFHLSTGVIMGLNTFLWSFAATFPAVLACRAQLPW